MPTPAKTKAAAKPKVTIYEIAREAGVSSSTVARVLRGDVKETWKSTARRADRIRQLAQDMGYRTNWRARAFSEQRTWTLGMISTPNLRWFESVHAEFVTGFNETIRAQGYHLMFVQAESEQFEDIVLGSRLDGCAMLEFLPEKTRRILRQSNIPAVLLNSDADPTLPRIVVDDFGGGYQAAQHLLELGHRKFAFYINHDADPHDSINERRRGIDTALQTAGLPPVAFHHCSDAEITAQLENPDTRPTALICYSQAEAIPVLSTLYRLNLRVPDAISVLCFNDVYPTAVTSPPLTTVAYDSRRLGKVGAQLLLRRINQDPPQAGPPKAYTLKNHTVVRASTGPPAIP